jgi:hypothetical protein
VYLACNEVCRLDVVPRPHYNSFTIHSSSLFFNILRTALSLSFSRIFAKREGGLQKNKKVDETRYAGTGLCHTTQTLNTRPCLENKTV